MPARPLSYSPLPTDAPCPPPISQVAIAYSSSAQYLVPSGAVVAVLIDNTDTVELPLRLHGHTVWLLATSERAGAEVEFAASPMRRDTFVVPARGWAKVAFVADSPGIWVLEGTKEWHVAAGLNLQLLTALPA